MKVLISPLCGLLGMALCFFAGLVVGADPQVSGIFGSFLGAAMGAMLGLAAGWDSEDRHRLAS